jgi:hypothetical protein
LEDATANFESLKSSPEGAEKGPGGKPKRQVARQQMTKLQQQLTALSDPAANGAAVHGVREGKAIGDTELRIRGEAEKLGPKIARGYLTAFVVPDAPTLNAERSGRLELAQWLSSSQNPLTARVAANRVWQHLFGAGIVSSVDNFGVTGDAPSHPELLDYLAQRLIDNQWSIKKLVRSLVLTRSYQLSADSIAKNVQVDPANRLVWRHSPRRLDAEEIRDAMLAAAGTIQQNPPDISPVKKLKVVEIRNNGPEAKQITEAAQASAHRSLYLPLLRDLTPTSLEVFDFAEQGMVTGSRDTTTVATQALYLLNDPFVRKQALALAESLLAQRDSNVPQRVVEAYRRTLGRAPSSAEIKRAIDYLADFEKTAAEVRGGEVSAPSEQLAAIDPTPMESTSSPKAPVIDPDQVVSEEIKVPEEIIKPNGAKATAWASLCQALFGSAEFRYVR